MSDIFKKNIFKDKVALVTGASRGIGRAVAFQLGSLGCNVAVNFNTSEEKAEEVKMHIVDNDGEAEIFRADISERGQVNDMVQKIVAKWHKIDFLINNAGKKDDKLFLYMDREWEEVFRTNVQGVFNCCKEVAPIMVEQSFGRIINFLSVVAFTGGVGISNYASSKSALVGFTKCLSKELAGYNITVNAVSPGMIDTDMTKKIPQDTIRALLKQIPLKRIGKASHVADAVCFLLSDGGEYITGEIIHVDGGM